MDNIHTFDTTLEVETYNGLFDPVTDSFKMRYNYMHILGLINSDPIFGKTDARIFFQLSSGGYRFKNVPGSLYLDSVVLVLDRGTYRSVNYGDTLAPQTIRVSEIDPSAEFKADSVTAYQLNKLFPTTGVLGTATIVPASLKDSSVLINYPNYGDTTPVANQIRIKLSNSFGQRLLSYDSTGIRNYDSVFATKFKGFAIESVGGGNALMGIDLTSSNTRLELYYRYDNATTPTDMDTSVVTYSFLGSSSYANANANYIKRDYSGTQVLTGSGDQVPDPVVYIQNNPGTYTHIKIPKLGALPNCVVHLAELQMESIYDVSDSIFYPWPNIFLDVYDSSAAKYKLVPNLFSLSSTSGGYALNGLEAFYSTKTLLQPFYYKKDASDNRVRQLRFNLTRYAQQIVSHHQTAYLMRLYAPTAVRLPLGDPAATDDIKVTIPTSTGGVPGIGRIRFGGGNHPTQKMKLRIVYSKL
ncbi:hypothetical protein GCM10027516_30090 [Niabella aquatica]